MQQTLLEAHRGLDKFRGTTDGEWLAWLKRIVQHNAADFVRRYGKAGKRRAAREVSLDVPAGDDSRGPGRDPRDSASRLPAKSFSAARKNSKSPRPSRDFPPTIRK